MAVSAGARKMSKSDNFDDILDAPERETLIEWLHHQPLIHHQYGVTLVHAGIPPMWTINDAINRASEVEAVLRAPNCIAFFNEMYGNDPIVWSDDLTGMTRLRVITNYLTRMRYCTKKGKLDLISKGSTPTANALAGKKVAPWFSHENRLTKTDRVIFGHWASIDGMTNSVNTIALDTGTRAGSSTPAASAKLVTNARMSTRSFSARSAMTFGALRDARLSSRISTRRASRICFARSA